MVNVLVLGSNSGGQLGTSDKQDAHTLITSTLACDARVYIVGGGNHALAWLHDGTQLYVCGSNTDGELGMCTRKGDNVDTELMWKSVKLPGARVVQVACGWNHTLVLDEDGVVMGSGCNLHKQLVHEDMNRIFGWTNVGLDGSNKFSAIACGMRHSMALTQSKVYAWGANRSGQLGVAPHTNASHQICVSNELPPISMIACGRNHSVVVAQDKRTVFVAGQDKYGQCGPSMLAAGSWRSFVLPRPAKKLCSGWDTCAVVLEPSEHEPYNVVMWGRADHGQLACNVDAKFSRELVNVQLANVVDLVCGSNHSIARTSDGDVYAWGWNEHGNAGDLSLRDVYTPLKLTEWPSGTNRMVAGIGCGYGNSYIMLDNLSNSLSNAPEAHPNT
ncbi:hypothetical protein GGH12_000693 [Coemansia sp. RSA 1822]|nr:hypothetical protein LPJ76_002828 [Coemansia sp. RSA 638]KAJ2566735.1 hypothetical protein GGH12_000693 [Coemansia sp. RSA 1822]